jgi:hypothetical protein
MAKEQDEAMRQKQIEANRKESAEAARKQLGIPKKNVKDENPPASRDNPGR